MVIYSPCWLTSPRRFTQRFYIMNKTIRNYNHPGSINAPFQCLSQTTEKRRVHFRRMQMGWQESQKHVVGRHTGIKQRNSFASKSCPWWEATPWRSGTPAPTAVLVNFTLVSSVRSIYLYAACLSQLSASGGGPLQSTCESTGEYHAKEPRVTSRQSRVELAPGALGWWRRRANCG